MVTGIDHRVDIEHLGRRAPAEALAHNEIGLVSLRLTEPVFVDDYRHHRVTGSFVLDRPGEQPDGRGRDDPPRRGVVTPASAAQAGPVWHDSAVTRAERWARHGLRGATVWFTGLSGSGKSTLADAVAVELLGGDGSPTSSTATTCATGSTTTSASRRPIAPRTCAASARWRA